MTSNETVVGGPILTRTEHEQLLTATTEAVRRAKDDRDKAIRAAVNDGGMKVSEVAAVIGMHRNTVHRALNGGLDD